MTDLQPTPMELDLEDGATLSMLVASPDDPRGLVVLIHGLTGSKEDFATMLPYLAEAGYTAVAYDQRGHHETDAEGPFSLPQLAQDAATVAHAFTTDLDSIVHLVGHSFGGVVATEAVLTDPHTWTTMTLLCSGPAGLPGNPWVEGLRSLLAEGKSMAEIFRARRAADPTPLPEDRAELLRRRFLASDPEALDEMAKALLNAPDRLQQLVDSDVQCFVVFGEDDDMWPLEVQRAAADAFGTEPVVIRDAGHQPGVDQPKATAKAIVRHCAYLD
ncbi:MAG: alpha/beta hydrolase [Propionibacterium sp.]|nr:alpha/beta hydrolase [Propionibacterium sp.]